MAQTRERAVLPLSVQNAYRERYRAIRPGWKSSGDELEAMVRSHVTARSRILDLGCGRGGVVELLWREVELAAGLDPDSPSLSEHRAQGMPVVRGVGERMPFVDESFDLIVCLWVLEHLKDPVEAFREVRRVLRPRGHFVFVTPNMRNPLMVANRIGTEDLTIEAHVEGTIQLKEPVLPIGPSGGIKAQLSVKLVIALNQITN